MLKKKRTAGTSIKKQKIKSIPSRKKVIGAIALLAVGLIMMPTGFVLADVIQGEIDEGVEDYTASPAEGDEGYGYWLTDDYDDAIPTYIKFYMYDLRNPDHFLDGDKPIFKEKGPYYFQKYSHKYDVDFDADEDKVKYNSYTNYKFLPEKSTTGASLDDKITNINPAYLGVMEEVGNERELIKNMFPEVLKQLKEEWETEFMVEISENPLIQDITESYPHWDLPSADAFFFDYWANDTAAPIEDYGDDVLFGPYPLIELIQANVILEMRNNGDIDGRYGYIGTPLWDINISTGPSIYIWLPLDPPVMAYTGNPGNPSGINITQCQALWDPENPLSLTGMDVMENSIWFDAADGDVASQNALKTEFNLTDVQLNNVTTWVEASIESSMNGFVKNLAESNILENNAGLVVSRTVEEWLFTGVDWLVLQQDPSRSKVGIFDDVEDEAEAEEVGTDRWTKRTGKDDIEEVGQILEFNGENRVYFWEKEENIRGTGGTQFAPGVEKDEELEVFTSDMMRVIKFEYVKDVTKKDIDMLRFTFVEETWEPNDNYDMDTEGLINLLAVRGSPVMLSKPHFLDADDDLRDDIKGIDSPAKKNDEFFIDVEPTTGLVMNAHQRIQVNIEVDTLDEWNTEHRDLVMPIFWYDEFGTITDELAEEFVELVYGNEELKENVPIWFLGLGAGLCIPGAALMTSQVVKYRQVKQGKAIKKDKLLKEKSETKKKTLLKSSDKPDVKSDEI